MDDRVNIQVLDSPASLVQAREDWERSRVDPDRVLASLVETWGRGGGLDLGARVLRHVKDNVDLYVPRLQRMVQGDDVATAVEAARFAWRCCSRNLSDGLVRWLSHSDGGVRSSCLDVIACTGLRDIGPLLALLDAEPPPDAHDRRRIAEGVATTGTPGWERDLRKRVRIEDPDHRPLMPSLAQSALGGAFLAELGWFLESHRNQAHEYRDVFSAYLRDDTPRALTAGVLPLLHKFGTDESCPEHDWFVAEFIRHASSGWKRELLRLREAAPDSARGQQTARRLEELGAGRRDDMGHHLDRVLQRLKKLGVIRRVPPMEKLSEIMRDSDDPTRPSRYDVASALEASRQAFSLLQRTHLPPVPHDLAILDFSAVSEGRFRPGAVCEVDGVVQFIHSGRVYRSSVDGYPSDFFDRRTCSPSSIALLPITARHAVSWRSTWREVTRSACSSPTRRRPMRPTASRS